MCQVMEPLGRNRKYRLRYTLEMVPMSHNMKTFIHFHRSCRSISIWRGAIFDNFPAAVNVSDSRDQVLDLESGNDLTVIHYSSTSTHIPSFIIMCSTHVRENGVYISLIWPNSFGVTWPNALDELKNSCSVTPWRGTEAIIKTTKSVNLKIRGISAVHEITDRNFISQFSIKIPMSYR